MLEDVAPVLQRKLPSPVAERLMEGVEHVIVEVPVLLVIPTDGTEVSLEITVVAVEIHPLAPVTPTVYAPETVTLIFADVEPLLQM